MTNTNENNFEEMNEASQETSMNNDNEQNNNGQEAGNSSTEAEIEKLSKEKAALEDKLLRTAAELQNVRRRSAEEVEKAHKYGISKLIQDLIPIVENFYMSSDNQPEDSMKNDEKVKIFVEGIVMTKTELTKVLDKYKVKRIYPLGEEFNHDLHQAIAQIPSQEAEGTVVQVIQSGYELNGRLIRPALVGVAKPE